MSKSTEHTPTPWRRMARALYDANDCYIIEADYETAADVENIDRILRAVNSHAALVEALDETYALLAHPDVRHYVGTRMGEMAQLHAALNKARAALALAKSSSTEGV